MKKPIINLTPSLFLTPGATREGEAADPAGRQPGGEGARARHQHQAMGGHRGQALQGLLLTHGEVQSQARDHAGADGRCKY